MFKTFKKILVYCLLITSSCFLFTTPVFAKTEKWQDINGGKCVSSTDPDVPTIQGLECIFYNILQVIVVVAGLAFFAMLVINGFKYLFSASDQKKLAEVNASLTMSVVGIVGIIASWLIIRFIDQFTGLDTFASLTNFVIPGP